MSRIDNIGQNGNEGEHYPCSGCVVKCDDCTDVVNHPSHYTSHPSGIECIQVTEHMDFLLGNALKYIWRAGLKDDKVQDLKKAEFYIKRAIDKESNSE